VIRENPRLVKKDVVRENPRLVKKDVVREIRVS
jgi:hypothetical protein